MNMGENGKERVQLEMILKERPAFFIRWGLLMFVVIISVIFAFTYYAGVLNQT